jgi:ATP-dependent Clp protease ATP-binding subunit ClpB
MTSNIGSELILEAKSLTDAVKNKIEEQLRRTFKPEFLNRIDTTVFFRMLTQEDVIKIAQLQLDELKTRLEDRDIALTVQKSVVEKIAELGFEREFGARPLRRAIQHYLAGPLAEFLLKNPDAKEITISVKGDQFKFS